MKKIFSIIFLSFTVILPHKASLGASDGGRILQSHNLESEFVKYNFKQMQSEIANYNTLTLAERKILASGFVQYTLGRAFTIWSFSGFIKEGETLAVHFVRGILAAALDVAGIDNPGENILTSKNINNAKAQFEVAFSILEKFLKEDYNRTLEDFAQQALNNRPNGFYQRHLQSEKANSFRDFFLAAKKPNNEQQEFTNSSNQNHENTTRTTSVTNDSSSASQIKNAIDPGMIDRPGAAIVFGDRNFPAEAARLASNSIGNNGGLTRFDFGGFPAIDGQTSSAFVCSANTCTDSGTIRWGTWNSGTVNTSGRNFTASNIDVLHYIIGFPTEPQIVSTRTGTVNFSPAGGTQAIGSNGTIYNATIGNINVNFSTSSATLSQYALTGGAINASDYTFTNIPLNITSQGSAALISGAMTNQGQKVFTLQGFFAGGAASHIGAAIKVTDNNSISINQVQSFKE